MSDQSLNATILRDGRVQCWSFLSVMSVGDYLALVEGAYKKRGGLKGQRLPLKTATGRRIRSRMVEDIKRGAVLPPVVIGVVIHEDLEQVARISPDTLVSKIKTEWIGAISIIDGMQRTTALLDAAEEDSLVKNQQMRVECWLSQNTTSLIYRMLVLNAGQVPWSIKQQLLVVFDSFIEEMRTHVSFARLLSKEKAERRRNGGEFNPDSLVEAYIAFGLRRTEIDTQETLADEFSRLDIAEAISSKRYDKFFYPIVQTLVDLDVAFSRLDVATEGFDGDDRSATYKFAIGRNIFDSQPARIGFVVACSIAVLGRLGMDKGVADSDNALSQLRSDTANLVSRLEGMEAIGLKNFLALDVLSEKLGGQKRSAVGRHERTFFETAFKVLIEERFKVPSLEVCWRA